MNIGKEVMINFEKGFKSSSVISLMPIYLLRGLYFEDREPVGG